MRFTTPYSSRRYHNAIAIALLAASAASMHTTAAGTTYYRWVDERGDTIHSDRQPPAGTKYEIVNAGKGFSYSLPSDEEATPEDETSKPITADSRKDPVACQQAKDNMRTLKGKDKIAVKDENGKTKILSKSEIKLQVELTRGHIDIFCE